MSRSELIEALGRQNPEGYQEKGGALPWASPDPPAAFPRATATRHSLLAALHEQLRPRTYWEVGVESGRSLQQSRTRSIGVDPYFKITAPIHCDVRLFRETSDNYFRRPDAFEHFDGVPVDLAFIDGMHLAEFALRDFMNIEKQMSAGGVVVIDDMLPRNSLEAFRVRRTKAWTGDVYKIHEVLAEYRSDLTVVPVNTKPTGSYLVVGVDPSSTVLADHYAEIEASLTTPDPQVVPDAWLERRTAVDPEDVVGLAVWEKVAELRDLGADREQFRPLWEQLSGLPAVGGP